MGKNKGAGKGVGKDEGAVSRGLCIAVKDIPNATTDHAR